MGKEECRRQQPKAVEHENGEKSRERRERDHQHRHLANQYIHDGQQQPKHSEQFGQFIGGGLYRSLRLFQNFGSELC